MKTILLSCTAILSFTLHAQTISIQTASRNTINEFLSDPNAKYQYDSLEVCDVVQTKFERVGKNKSGVMYQYFEILLNKNGTIEIPFVTYEKLKEGDKVCFWIYRCLRLNQK